MQAPSRQDVLIEVRQLFIFHTTLLPHTPQTKGKKAYVCRLVLTDMFRLIDYSTLSPDPHLRQVLQALEHDKYCIVESAIKSEHPTRDLLDKGIARRSLEALGVEDCFVDILCLKRTTMELDIQAFVGIVGNLVPSQILYMDISEERCKMAMNCGLTTLFIGTLQESQSVCHFCSESLYTMGKSVPELFAYKNINKKPFALARRDVFSKKSINLDDRPMLASTLMMSEEELLQQQPRKVPRKPILAAPLKKQHYNLQDDAPISDSDLIPHTTTSKKQYLGNVPMAVTPKKFSNLLHLPTYVDDDPHAKRPTKIVLEPVQKKGSKHNKHHNKILQDDVQLTTDDLDLKPLSEQPKRLFKASFLDEDEIEKQLTNRKKQLPPIALFPSQNTLLPHIAVK